MTEIKIIFENNVKCVVDCDRAIAAELSEYFSFYADGYRFHPKYKNGLWDGKIRLFSMLTQKIYAGLIPRIAKFAKINSYSFEVDANYKQLNTDLTIEVVDQFISELGLPFKPRDYQVKAVQQCLFNKRLTVSSPTSSGKSLIIYSIIRFLESQNKKILLVVPNISLVKQMESDFKQYGYQKDVHLVSAGVEKSSELSVTISTWQSIYKEPVGYFKQYDAVFVDEVHQAKSNSLTGILEKADCEYRYGFSGTVSGGKKVHELTITGLFGAIHKTTTTKKLMEAGLVATAKLKCVTLLYPDADRKVVSKMTYPDEINWLLSNKKRNNFIANLAIKQKKNTLVLFNNIVHGEELARIINEKCDKPVYYISGKISGDEREEIRQQLEIEDNCVLVANVATTATGVSINNLHNIIFTHPSKSMIRTIQAIGRMLRLHKDKDTAVLYDIIDDCSWKRKMNFAAKHFVERMRHYNSEKHNYSIHKINFK